MELYLEGTATMSLRFVNWIGRSVYVQHWQSSPHQHGSFTGGFVVFVAVLRERLEVLEVGGIFAEEVVVQDLFDEVWYICLERGKLRWNGGGGEA